MRMVLVLCLIPFLDLVRLRCVVLPAAERTLPFALL